MESIVRSQPVGTTFAKFQHDIRTAANGVFPSKRPYKNVVMIISFWDVRPCEEAHLTTDILDLLDVCRRKYNFRVHQVMLDAKIDAHTAAEKYKGQVLAILKEVSEDNQIIFYHGGYGLHVPMLGLIVGPRRNSDWRTFRLGSFLQAQFEPLSNDVIYLFDCCHSSRLALKSGQELVAASMSESYNNTTTRFTRHLAQVLEHQYPVPITVAHLHQKLSQSSRAESNIDRELRAQPFHLQLHYRQQRSLTIGPVCKSSEHGFPHMPPVVEALLKDDSPKALVTVRLSDVDPPRLTQWKIWHEQKMPSFIWQDDIALEGTWVSGSHSVLMLRMPVAIYNVFARAGRPYRLIELVECGNALLPTPAPQTRLTLDFKENVRPDPELRLMR